MRPTGLKRIIEVKFVIILIWMLTGCASQQWQYTPPPSTVAPTVEPELSPPAATIVEPEPASGVSSKIPVSKKPEFYVHKVRWPGETISLIAQWYTGSQRNWEIIVKANPGFDPKRMHIGDKILIPKEIIENREPMPQNYLRTSSPESSESFSSLAKPATESYKTKALDSPGKKQGIEKSDKIELFELQDTEKFVPESDEIELFETTE